MTLTTPTFAHGANEHAGQASISLERIYAEPSLTGIAPRGLKISPDGQRVTYLQGKLEASETLDLWEHQIKSGKSRMLVDSQTLTGGTEVLSDEEKARRERQRMASLSGIVEYYFSDDGSKLLFPLSGALYVYTLKDGNVKKLTDANDGAASDVRFSPKGRYVSFVRGQNLLAIDLSSGKTIALSSDGGGTIANGVAEFVAQEEMARFTGYWWAPDESAVAMQRFDESAVPIERRFEIYADRAEVVEQRYPAAGKTNVTTQLFVVPVSNPEARIRIDLGAEKDIYLARVEWLPDSSKLSFQRQSRDQRILDLMLADRKTGASGLLVHEQSTTYINLHDDLRFLSQGQEFVWSSEANSGGFRHLALYGLDGKKRRDLTRGDFSVNALLAVNEKAGVVYFSANIEDVNQHHIYSVPIDGSAKIKRISQGAGTHQAIFAKDGTAYLDTYSDWNTPPQVRLHQASGKVLKVLSANALDENHPYTEFAKQAITPEFGSLMQGQVRLHYRMFKPKNFDASKKYPALVYTYGGPHVQVLSRAWDARWGQMLQYYAQQGYVVFSLDNRGSDHRGRDFESAIYRQMGGPDVADQLAGIRWLGSQDFVDAERIGVFGWSYGGYMTLHVLAQGGDLVRAGVAGAPVTDWGKYDTHYTERYMDLPARNVEGYRRSSVLTHLDGMTARLLLIHGMADDNVMFTNSTTLMSWLQTRGVAFDLMTYPGMKHGPADNQTRLHVFRGAAEFFKRELRPGQ